MVTCQDLRVHFNESIKSWGQQASYRFRFLDHQHSTLNRPIETTIHSIPHIYILHVHTLAQKDSSIPKTHNHILNKIQIYSAQNIAKD